MEYYFGKDNLLKDTFLRGKMDPQNGWTPVSIPAGFARLMKMTTDMKVVIEAIQDSSIIELDTNQTCVRPKDWQNWVLQDAQQAQSGPPSTQA